MEGQYGRGGCFRVRHQNDTVSIIRPSVSAFLRQDAANHEVPVVAA